MAAWGAPEDVMAETIRVGDKAETNQFDWQQVSSVVVSPVAVVLTFISGETARRIPGNRYRVQRKGTPVKLTH